MSIKQFTQKQNIQMLWDVISDEDIFRFLTPDIQSNIYQLFLNNIQGFFEVERSKNQLLVDLNKKYILLILNHIKKTYPYQPSKIKIHNEPDVKELITYEEIQNDRKSQFERDLNKRQLEFDDSINVKAPPVPNFSDKNTDSPIKEMDKLVKEIQAQRNYEVDQLNRTYNTSIQVDNWLKPKETSLKTDKIQNLEIKEEQTQNYSRFKFLNELEQEMSPTNTKKSVTFNNNDEIKTFSVQDDEEDNILLKLKTIPKKDENITLEIHEQNSNELNINEERFIKLERNIYILNEKIDKIFQLLSKKN